MDFTLSETEEALRDLTARILGDQADAARRKAAEADARGGGPGLDAALWSALGDAGLLAAFLEPAPEAANRGRERVDGGHNVTGSGGAADAANRGRERVDGGHDVTGSTDDDRPGVVAAALMCREGGATVAPVPLVPTLAALLAARDSADPRVAAACAAVGEGRSWAAVATPELGGAEPRWAPVAVAEAGEGAVLDGTIGLVADLPGAAWLVVEAVDADGSSGNYWVDASALGVTVQHVVTTAARAAGHLTLASTPAIPLRSPASAGLILQTLICATQAGVCSSAIGEAASYLGTRHQFGRPLASFQAPVHRLVDAHIDTDAIWLTALLAAWRLDEGIDATAAVDVARWWAADAGNRAVHTVQHLHGGIGADIDYPVHRYFLWAKALGDSLGGGAAHLAHLGSLIAAGADL